MESTAEKVVPVPGALLRASLFGPFTLATSTGAEIVISNRRARALLAMLCLAPGEALERDYVSKLLWPGRFQAQARASLRQCLLDLDKLLTPLAGRVIDSSHGRIAIDPSGIQSDLAHLENALTQARVAEACRLLAATGDRLLLDQANFGDPFREWLIARRRHVDGRLQIAVDRAVAALQRDGDPEGQRQLGDAWRACGRAPAPQERKIRIAVLPFAQHDAIGGPLFLAEGVVEEMSFRLASIPALAVIGRTSVISSGRTLPAMASALNVSNLIDGEVHRFAEGIRVSLRLIDGQSGTEIRSDRYDGTVADAMGSRHIIGSHCLTGLCSALGVDARLAPARWMTTNRDAYALYLQGRALFMKTVGDNVIAKAIERLEQALRIDPDFAECWAALAEAHLYSATFTPTPDRRERAEAMAHCARRAITLDPSQGYARVTLAVYEFTRHNAVASLDLAYEAHRLAPNSSDVAVRLGAFLLFLGHAQAALPYLEAAVAGDPVHGRNYAALCAGHRTMADPYDISIAYPAIYMGHAELVMKSMVSSPTFPTCSA